MADRANADGNVPCFSSPWAVGHTQPHPEAWPAAVVLPTCWPGGTSAAVPGTPLATPPEPFIALQAHWRLTI